MPSAQPPQPPPRIAASRSPRAQRRPPRKWQAPPRRTQFAPSPPLLPAARSGSSCSSSGSCAFPFSGPNLAAAFAEREDFSGIQRGIWVERVMHSPHQVKICVAEEQRHQFILFHPDAMLPREHSTQFHAVPDDLLRRRDRLLKLFGVPRVVKHNRV